MSSLPARTPRPRRRERARTDPLPSNKKTSCECVCPPSSAAVKHCELRSRQATNQGSSISAPVGPTQFTPKRPPPVDTLEESQPKARERCSLPAANGVSARLGQARPRSGLPTAVHKCNRFKEAKDEEHSIEMKITQNSVRESS